MWTSTRVIRRTNEISANGSGIAFLKFMHGVRGVLPAPFFQQTHRDWMAFCICKSSSVTRTACHTSAFSLTMPSILVRPTIGKRMGKSRGYSWSNPIQAKSTVSAFPSRIRCFFCIILSESRIPVPRCRGSPESRRSRGSRSLAPPCSQFSPRSGQTVA